MIDHDEDDEFPCEGCCQYIGGLMHKAWSQMSATFAFTAVKQIEAIARATEPEDGDDAHRKVKMARTLEAVIVALITEIAEEHEDAALIDALHGRIIEQVTDYRVEKRKRDNAEHKRKAAPGNGGGSAWTQ